MDKMHRKRVIILLLLTGCCFSVTSAADKFRGDWTQFIEEVREQALTYTDRLPEFICKCTSHRWLFFSGIPAHQMDEVVAEISFYGKEEHSRLLSLGGKPVEGEAPVFVPGLRSQGEFGNSLQALFSPGTHASFIYDGRSKIKGRPTVRVKYSVSLENSRFIVTAAKDSFVTAYRGTCWVDARTKEIVRLESFAVGIPEDALVTYSSSRTDYGPVRIAGSLYWLPVTATVEFRARSSNGRKHFDFYGALLGPAASFRLNPKTIRAVNTVDFTDYQKFSTEIRLLPSSPEQ
jgi:hypothetical protein